MKLIRLNNKHNYWLKFVRNNSQEYKDYEYHSLQIYFINRYVFTMVYWISKVTD
jgi:hypothetical protein